ncbi:MAG: ABC transporter substrate-binding protein, partial [Chloroflexota bacterium]
MLRRSHLPLCLIGLLLLCATSLHARAALDKVRVITSPFLGNAPMIIADAEGFFEDAGIELEYVKLPDTIDASALAMTIKGDIDVFSGFVTPGAFNAIERGTNLRIVADSGYNKPGECAYWSFILPQGSDPATFDVASLKGKHVAVPQGVTQYYLSKLLEPAGLTLDDVTSDNIPAADRIPALDSGSVAAVWIGEPILTAQKQAEALQVWVTSTDFAPNEDLSVLNYGDTMLQRSDDLPVRFLKAYLRGSRQANEGATERNLDILSPTLNIPRDLLAQMCWDKFSADGAVHTDGLVDYMNWLYKQGQIDAVLDLDQFYDPSFTQAAAALLPEVTPEASA